MSAVAIEVSHASKRFGTNLALDDLSLNIHDNEFFTLLGPSGCGKTTLLRLIAGFEQLSSGNIMLFGNNMSNLPPNKRPVNTVFQQYALFPHLTVLENVQFGLLRLGDNANKAKARAQAMLDLVRLSELGNRLPSQLSGGQQQRVALARALAPSPKVLLLDEPLSALDLKLRQEVRLELQQIQSETGITFVFVTHDQEEALTMSNRIAVMSNGQLQQIGTPRDIYDKPINRFVADFIGETNLLPVTVKAIENNTADYQLTSGEVLSCAADETTTTDAKFVSIRPERIALVPSDQGDLSGVVVRQIYLGTDMQLSINLANHTTLTVRLQNTDLDRLPNTGDTVGLHIQANAARLLPT